MLSPPYAQTDWDWFFSSLAQSAAAIVAIFAGFIINKILSDHSAHLAAVDEMARLTTEAMRLREEAQALPFTDHAARVDARALAAAARLLVRDDNDGKGWTIDSLLKTVRMSTFNAPEANRARLAKLVEDLRSASPAELSRIGQEAIVLPMTSPLSRLGIPQYRPVLSSPWVAVDAAAGEERAWRAQIDDVRRAVNHHIRTVADFDATVARSKRNTDAVGWWLWLVVFLFFLGVVYPMSFLPASAPPLLTFRPWTLDTGITLRGMLLGGVSVAFLAVVLVFRTLNKSICHDAAKRRTLMAFSEVGAYAEAFAHEDANNKR